MEKISVLALAERITTEADAYRFIEDLRWHGTPVCPHCGGTERISFIKPANGVSRKTRTGSISERRVWFCGPCRKQFTVLVGTIFHGTKISLRKWLFVIFEMCASKNGVAAREIERKYELTGKTAWFMLHRIREAMKAGPLAEMMSGVIVADETYIGGAEKNKHAHKRNPNAGGGVGKVAVFTLINKHTGEARSRVVPDVTGANLAKIMNDHVIPSQSLLYTDKASVYPPIGRQFVAHESVDHGSGEYVRGDVTTNMAENFFSQLKRSIDGTHHHVSREHLDRYLHEFDYRYTTRDMSDTERMRRLFSRLAGRRLTYRGSLA